MLETSLGFLTKHVSEKMSKLSLPIPKRVLAPTDRILHIPKQSRPRTLADKRGDLLKAFQRQADRVGGPKLFSYEVDAVCDEHKLIDEHVDFIRDVVSATGGFSMTTGMANIVLAKIWKYNYKSWKENACDMKRWRDNQECRARMLLHVADKSAGWQLKLLQPRLGFR